MKSNKPELDDASTQLIDSYRDLVRALRDTLAWMSAAHDPKNPLYSDTTDEDRKAACTNARTLLKRIAEG